MYAPQTMLRKKQYASKPESPVNFGLNMRSREIKVEFEVHYTRKQRSNTSVTGSKEFTHRLRFTVPFRQMHQIQILRSDAKNLQLQMSLNAPPKFFKQSEGIFVPDEKALLWTEDDMWFRQTDMVADRKSLKNLSIRLDKKTPIVDFGNLILLRYVSES